MSLIVNICYYTTHFLQEIIRKYIIYFCDWTDVKYNIYIYIYIIHYHFDKKNAFVISSNLHSLGSKLCIKPYIILVWNAVQEKVPLHGKHSNQDKLCNVFHRAQFRDWPFLLYSHMQALVQFYVTILCPTNCLLMVQNITCCQWNCLHSPKCWDLFLMLSLGWWVIN